MMYVADFMKQLIFSIFWLAFLIVSMWTHVRSQHMYGGTIVVIAVTEDGVIVGADHLQEQKSLRFPDKAERMVVDKPKVVPCGEFICAAVHQQSADLDFSVETEPGVWKRWQFKYNFNSWIAKLIEEHAESSHRDVESFARLVAKKARETFEPVNVLLKTEARVAYQGSEAAAMFIVGGYDKDSKLPQIFRVPLKIDWKNLGLELSIPEKIFPQFEEESLPTTFMAGYRQNAVAADKGLDPQFSRAQVLLKMWLERMRVRLAKYPSSLQEAAAKVTTLVEVEGEFNPEKVGGPTTIVILRRRHHPESITFAKN